MGLTVHKLFTDIKKVYDSVRRAVAYRITLFLNSVYVPINLVTLIEKRLKENYTKLHTSKIPSLNCFGTVPQLSL
jgi:hypothetical protein